MKDYPVASKRFYLSYGLVHLSGKQIMGAVRQVMRDYGDEHADHYYQTRRYDNGDFYRIGRKSDNVKVNIIILADGSEWIQPSHIYTDVCVQSLVRTPDPQLCQDTDHSETISFVQSFAELLEKELFGQYVTAS